MCEYKSPFSNIQFNTLFKNKYINDTVTPDNDIIARLLALTMKRFNNKLYEKVRSILQKNITDTEIYNELSILYNSISNKIPKCIKRPNKNAIIINTLVSRLKYFMKFDFETNPILNYLDVGAGNGRFCKMFGKELKLDNNNIHGIDIPSFSEQGDWNRNEITNDIVFKTINKDDVYPYSDNKFNIVTMKMVLHHIENIDLTLNEIARVLYNNGYLIIIEHDVRDYLDQILCEIEHLYYIKVFNKNTTNTKYRDNTNINDEYNDEYNDEDNDEDIKSLGYLQFRNLEETNKIFSKFGFIELESDFFYENNQISPTRNYWTIFQLNK